MRQRVTAALGAVSSGSLNDRLRRSRAAIDEWLERMGLSDWADKRVATLSKGMAQKVQLATAIVNKPNRSVPIWRISIGMLTAATSSGSNCPQML